jgi:phosphoribosylglycinamide formyltransferase 1
MKAVILISGNGSNLQSIIDNASKIDLQICCVISNKADAFGLKRAQKAGIDCIFIDPLLFDSNLAFDKELISVIDQHKVEVIILAGFMRILSSDFISKYFGKILNIHPSLLPKFPGLNTHQKAIESSEKIHGASVHFVTVKLDSGPVIAKETVFIDPKDDATTLSNKVLQKEHILYPKVIQWYTQKRLKLIDENTATLDGRVL